jgi:hypothetical protein
VDRGAVLRPVGPEPARVYWVRRAFVLAILLIVVVALARACTGGGSSPQSTPKATSPSPSPSPSSHRPPRCTSADLDVKASADADTYPAGATPRFTARVRNTANHPCRLSTRPAARVWTVVSGADPVWSTADCTPKRGHAFTRLHAGEGVTYAVAWDRHRSVKGCSGPGDSAQPGTYRLTVRIDRGSAAPVVFHLTG